MKKVTIAIILASFFISTYSHVFAQSDIPFIISKGINKTNIYVRGNPVVVEEITVNIPSEGKVLVHFNGDCYPDNGDNITLAASDHPDWVTNDGNVNVFNEMGNFSHSRVYDVTPGNQTFYAIAENYTQQGGSGYTSIYASLTVEFFPNNSDAFISHTGINKTHIYVRGNPVVVEELTVNIPFEGKVLVHFNGSCHPDNGDNITLAASDHPDWVTNDGNVNVFNEMGNFSHSRVYDVTSGNHTFYAIAENYTLQGGDGYTSIYASLTVEYFPINNDALISHTGINKTHIYVRGNPVVVEELTVNIPFEGKVLVHFNGSCHPDNGDNITLAASDHPDWVTNDGNVNVFNEMGNFSHSRVYDVTPGNHTFYAIAENYTLQGGDGYTSIYASLTVEYFPSSYPVTFNVDISEATGFNPDNTDIYISADFAGWPQPGTDPSLIMTVTANPNIYTCTWEFPGGENQIQYKYFFVYDNIPSWEYGEWGGDPNRHEVFIGPTTVDDIWANQPRNVEFRVDLTGITFNPDTTDIYIAGTFGDWAMPGTVGYWKMDPLYDDLYHISKWIYSGEQQYKYFMVHNGTPSWDHGEWDGDPNRIANIVNDTIIEDIWGLITGIHDIAEIPLIDVYPNPCSSSIQIILDQVDLPVKKIGIYDVSGALVSRYEYINSRIITIDTDQLLTGLYFIVVSTKQGPKTAKFIKQ